MSSNHDAKHSRSLENFDYTKYLNKPYLKERYGIDTEEISSSKNTSCLFNEITKPPNIQDKNLEKIIYININNNPRCSIESYLLGHTYTPENDE